MQLRISCASMKWFNPTKYTKFTKVELEETVKKYNAGELTPALDDVSHVLAHLTLTSMLSVMKPDSIGYLHKDLTLWVVMTKVSQHSEIVEVVIDSDCCSFEGLGPAAGVFRDLIVTLDAVY
jgi:hypothetical protein